MTCRLERRFTTKVRPGSFQIIYSIIQHKDMSLSLPYSPVAFFILVVSGLGFALPDMTCWLDRLSFACIILGVAIFLVASAETINLNGYKSREYLDLDLNLMPQSYLLNMV